MTKRIEVFRDMYLHGPLANRIALRTALIEAATEPWRVDLEQSADVANQAVISEDVLLFRREPSNEYPAVGLTLWGTDEGYYVPNIVPLQTGSLTFKQYNAVLTDFIADVVNPVISQFGFTIRTTESSQGLEDWVSPDVAVKLRRFSGAANKSSGRSHPMDERRWFEFVIAVHRSDRNLDPNRLARWLNEAEGWDEDSAHKLAGDFENSLSLLAQYDQG